MVGSGFEILGLVVLCLKILEIVVPQMVAFRTCHSRNGRSRIGTSTNTKAGQSYFNKSLSVKALKHCAKALTIERFIFKTYSINVKEIEKNLL
jgi:hypothetical protein